MLQNFITMYLFKSKKINIFLITIFTITALCYCIYLYLGSYNRFLNFLKNNPEKYSIYSSINDNVFQKHNTEKQFYLASTKKIILLIELSNQIDEKLINEDLNVSTKELDKLYLKGLDGGAHENWKKSLIESNINIKDSISLNNVVNGMIEFSSNACTDYILNLLTIEKVNKCTLQFGVNKPNDFLYFSSLILTDSTKLKDNNYSELKIENEKIYNKLILNKFNTENIQLSLRFQEILLKRTEKASTSDYYNILSQIYTNEHKYKFVKDHLNWILKKKDNKKYFTYYGGKGGSLLGVYTYSCFAINKENEKININFFINEMDYLDWFLYQDSFLKFVKNYCKSKTERINIVSKI